MVQTTYSQETVQTLKSKMIAIYEYFIQQNDLSNAEKVKQLAKKLENQEFMIAFCGHFSAGKSTMINQVIGENLLPSSPIPTSANLVKIKTGEEYAKVFFKHAKPRLYLAPYDYQLVKNYCKDGDQINEIEISYADSQLPINTVIMDTPGIDSADDAHRVATESAMHLADLIFYVMDYNHVQAELNFLFTKELVEAGKEIYLVINQIDKHNSEELSFQDFQKSVVDSFAAWGVKPSRIFYTSLKHPEHTFNEFDELKQFIADKLNQKEQALLPSIFHSLKKIAQDHIEYVRKVNEDLLQPKIEILHDLSETERTAIKDSYHHIEMSLQTISKSLEDSEKEFTDKTVQIINNAYLMPFQTRSLAESFLESQQREFKVGFLFSKQKTEEERATRLEKLYQDISDKTKSQLEWHIREYLISFIKQHQLDQGELLAKAQSMTLDVPVELLINAVKSGARLSGEYVLHYTDELANGLKKLARNNVEDFKSFLFDTLKEKASKLEEREKQELTRVGKYVDAFAELKAFEDQQVRREQEIEGLLQQIPLERDDYQLFNHVEEEFEVIKGNFEIIVDKPEPVTRKTSTTLKNQNLEIQQNNGQQNKMVDRLKLASDSIISVPGFAKLAKELDEKAERLANKGFTVALFGAFSAGKSSFANALMGEKVLPVSPNPTTAAINKIKPITEQYSHGTVLVKFKEKDAMLADLNRSLKVFDLMAQDFTDASSKIDQVMQKGQKDVLEKTHFSFLMAFKNGYESHIGMLGTTIETNLNEFAEFVAKEEKSCYVEWIELYYDCELTRKGITLVDTPGADSINARHTGVAFEYIKNSDAILFVTYYNHAFSKADREFLIQLGRVKESFQMDKMFFIINAIDLAENDEEQEAVSEYVKEQLGKYGINKPHLYSLSSLLAMKEKTESNVAFDSGMPEFEQAFYHFISSDLTEMAITSAGSELMRVQEMLGRLIQSSQEDQSIKEQKRKDIEIQKVVIRELVEKQIVDNILTRLLHESNELVYYIKRRVFLRFSDFFKESFNPSVLRDDGRNLKKALQTALDEFLEGLGFDFAQEMRATTVRLDRFLEKVLLEYQSMLTRNLQEINPDLSFSEFDIKHEKDIDFQSAFSNMEKQIFVKAISYFKNPKSFFEKNEKRLMSEELQNILDGYADQYLQEESARLNHHYTQVLTSEFSRLLHHMNEEMDNFYFSYLSALDGGVSVEELKEIQKKLGQNQ
ncbi:dynamin family protein [Neobacillus massiliamazoniensis]|uniref:Dynamin family protein n=1 Tax=Neobacillus massiliamazoniensis TaxID=1499688 RepID=A0A0U1P0P7_9BACI|nr:dynamin family protein [Neobacillus massiliamazoniensis]CRK83865.1 Dynamin family protein [Neobacillus massiliamazoniensis]